jgi:NAD(P)-dependent dehydrogenase (short-subunit alcohol dehydrogenase family)
MAGVKNKIIVITGGCGDIGAATSKRLAADGAKVVLLDLLPVPAGDAAAKGAGAAAYYLCDQGDRVAVEKTLGEVAARFGRVDVVIANAAIVHRYRFQDTPPEIWEQYLRVNLSGCFYLAQSAVRLMLKQSRGKDGIRGKVLFTSSWTAQHPLPGNMPYVITKSSIETMAIAIAQELAHEGIIANALAPGILYAGLTKKLCDTIPDLRQALTDLVPLGELGNPQQVAEAYYYLCADESNYMTGQVMTVDGGCSVIKRKLPDT